MTDDVSPRVLLRTTTYAPDGETPDDVAYEATQPKGNIWNQTDVDRDILGYAELPRQTEIGRHTDAETFVRAIESLAEYLHWKPDVQIHEYKT